MIIAIDGPAGAGKSTVCKRLAARLRYLYLDTGAMYRAVAWALCQRLGDDPEPAKIAATLPSLPLQFRIKDHGLHIRFGALHLTDQLRTPEVTALASAISQLPVIREYLTQWQRRLAKGHAVVAEGRDTATVVFPDADLKVFLTADLATRAERRFRQWQAQGIACDQREIEARIAARDQADRERQVAPLRASRDAHQIDTSGLSIEQVVNRILELVDDRGNNSEPAPEKSEK